MAISRSSTGPEISEETLTGPGRRLREARIARKLDIEEVAARLHLHRSTIQRIEADDYENLPAPTFVRGYLRGYARMLDISPEKIIGDYNSHNFEPPPLVRDICNTAEVRSTDFPFRLATYLILTVVVVLVAIWWQNQETGLPRPASPDSSNPTLGVSSAEQLNGAQESRTEAGAASPSADGPETPKTAPTAPFEFGSTDTQNGPAVSAAAELVAQSPANETSALSDDSTAGGGDTVTTQSSGDAEAAGAQTATGDGVAQAAAPVPQQAPMTLTPSRLVKLRIVVGMQSWVEIFNQDDQRLYYDLAEAGSVIEITDRAPFKVLLGNTTDVHVEFDGSPFDISPFTSNGVARFEWAPQPGPVGELQSVFQSSQLQ